MLKEQTAREITDLLKLEPVTFSTGSTEPRELFISIIETLGLTNKKNGSKPELAKLIVEFAGLSWLPEYESSGSTITGKGLSAVKSAVELFIKGDLDN
jgi:hypothetical protein